MSTTYGVIKSALHETEITVYTSMYKSVTLFSKLNENVYGVKVILDQENIDEFLSAISCALREKNIFSNYLNPEGEYIKDEVKK